MKGDQCSSMVEQIEIWIMDLDLDLDYGLCQDTYRFAIHKFEMWLCEELLNI